VEDQEELLMEQEVVEPEVTDLLGLDQRLYKEQHYQFVEQHHIQLQLEQEELQLHQQIKVMMVLLQYFQQLHQQEVEQEVEDQILVQLLLEIQEDQEEVEHGLYLEQEEQEILRQ
jgi:hypothetical protein